MVNLDAKFACGISMKNTEKRYEADSVALVRDKVKGR